MGGVNTKAARLAVGGDLLAAHSRPYEIQRDPAALPGLLRDMARELGAAADAAHAVTLTAELSQYFRLKRDGVAFVLDAVAAAFPGAFTRVFAVDGRWLDPGEARRDPFAVAAANWAAAARIVARRWPDALFVDIGTTTCDIVPIVGGVVAAVGRTDPERLAAGELLYTGALRTPVEAIVREAPYRGTPAGVSAEGFALSGDVHLWRGDLRPGDYSVAAPDGRPATREFAGERLARVVCADRELVDERGIDAIAAHVAASQRTLVAAALRRQHAAHPTIDAAVVAGLGEFLAVDAAASAGLRPLRLAGALGDDAARSAPAVAVATLLAERLRESGRA